MKSLILFILLFAGITYSQVNPFPVNTFWKDSSGVIVPKNNKSTLYFKIADTTAFNSKTLTTAQLSYKADTSSVLWKDSSGVNVLKNYGDVSGMRTLTLKSPSVNESATLGAELLSASNWTTTGWTGDFATGFTHTAGNTTALTNSIAAVTNSLYQITVTISGGTTGTVTVTFGDVTSSASGSTFTTGIKALSTRTLSITPTDPFDKTVIISIKQITTPSNATFIIKDNLGNNSFEIRNTLASLNNTFVGIGVGRYVTTGSNNTSMGYRSQYSLTTGSNNSSMGYASQYALTTGSNNTSIGYYSQYALTTGSNNTSMGNYSQYLLTTGSNNSSMGNYSQQSLTTGSYNSSMGYYSQYALTTGSYNSSMGYASQYSLTTGSYNSSMGYYSQYALTTGSNNTSMGNNSGRFGKDGTTGNDSSNNSVYLGAETRSGAIHTGTNTNEIVIGYNAIGAGSNSITLGNTSVTTLITSAKVSQFDSLNFHNEVSMIDSATIISIATGMAGWGEVMIGDNEEWASFRFTTAGVVTLISNSTNVSTTPFNPNTLNIYDAGTGIAIQNYLSAAQKKVAVNIKYFIP